MIVVLEAVCHDAAELIRVRYHRRYTWEIRVRNMKSKSVGCIRHLQLILLPNADTQASTAVLAAGIDGHAISPENVT